MKKIVVSAFWLILVSISVSAQNEEPGKNELTVWGGFAPAVRTFAEYDNLNTRAPGYPWMDSGKAVVRYAALSAPIERCPAAPPGIEVAGLCRPVGRLLWGVAGGPAWPAIENSVQVLC